MTRLLCCLRARADMGAAISHPQEGEACDGGVLASPPTMADVIRERKKKAGGAGLGTLRRRIAAAARRPRDARPDRGCEHARFIRSVVSSWRVAEVFQLSEELEAGAALRDLATQAELAREPAPALHQDLARMYRERWWCDVELVGAGWSLAAHRVILSARCTYFRDLLQRYPTSCRVPLEGVGGALSRDEAEACVFALYAGTSALNARCDRCSEWERGMNSDAELDIISVENSTQCRCGPLEQARARRVGALLGASGAGAARDLRRVLERGELADARLAWPAPPHGFRADLPCHRLLLAARSRFFRSVLSRRCAGAGGAGGVGSGVVCVDEKVLPRRFARALLHAAYTDQVDLSLIGRSSSSPSSSNSGSGTLRGNGRGSTIAMLDDAFQLYEIARFLEMPIVAQGCEDAAARALSADTLPHCLRWSAAPHASAWLHRQAMRYLRDEFPAVMASAAAARLPRPALAAALASPFLQASEAQALRALLRWAERAAQPAPPAAPAASAAPSAPGAPPPAAPQLCAEPNLLWHTTHARRAARARRRAAPDAALRHALAELLPLLRLEHLPPDCDALALAARRGLLPEGAGAAGAGAGGTVDAWLGRGGHRPARCFLPYLDELRALLHEQPRPPRAAAPPPQARAQRDAGRIPDTLYMVAEAASALAAARGACVPPRTLRALRRRAAELRAAAPAQRALRLHALDARDVRRQLALRAVREMSLPDSCAELLLDADAADDDDREGSEEWERGAARSDLDDSDCCRSGSGSLRRAGAAAALAALEPPRAACRRDAPARADAAHARSARYSRARLSAAVPDVAMAPNANTHLLTARDYPHPPPHAHAHAHAPPPAHAPPHAPPPHAHAQPHALHAVHAAHAAHAELGAVLQLDLGDGATHTPRPGSRAQRAARQHREHSQGMSCSRRDDDELRAAIELSVIRAYSSLQVARRAPAADLLPPPDFASARSRATPSPAALPAAAPAPAPAPARRRDAHLSIASSTAERRPAPGPSAPAATLALAGAPPGAGAARAGGGASRSPSPRRSPYPLYTLYAQRDFSRSEGGYGRAPRSRAHSPAPRTHAYA